jgi:hypothetical protein
VKITNARAMRIRVGRVAPLPTPSTRSEARPSMVSRVGAAGGMVVMEPVKPILSPPGSRFSTRCSHG